MCVVLVLFWVVAVFAPPAFAADVASKPADASAAVAPAAGPEIDLSGYVPSWAREEILGVSLWQFVAAFVLLLTGLAAKKVSDHVFAKVVTRLVRKTRFRIDDLAADAASRPFGYLLLLAGLGGAFGVLTLPTEPNVRGLVFGTLKVLLAADIMWFLFRLVDTAVEYLARLAERTESTLDDQLVPVIRKALKATIGVIFFVWIVQLLGYSVSSLIAGLGIGGLAVALALQDTLGNFFGSVFIFLDRPFCVGDWIKVGEVEGIVEQVGFRTTRVRTWPATLVSIPNKTVASATIDNWSRMPKRRVVQTVGVTYKTNADQMEDVVETIRQILMKDEGVDQEFIVVRFTEFGESSLNILVYYFTKAVTFADHLVTKERINLAIMRCLKKRGLSIAFPTRTVCLESSAGDVSVRERTRNAGDSQ